MAIEIGDTITFSVPKNIIGDLLTGKDLSLQDDEEEKEMEVEVLEIIPKSDHLELTAIVKQIKKEK